MSSCSRRAPRPIRALLLLAALALLPACGADPLDQLRQGFETRYEALGAALDRREVVNAVILERYADRVAAEQPDYAEVAAALAKEGTRAGNAYRSLRTEADRHADQPDRDTARYLLTRAIAMTDVRAFNDMLADPVNVLAALSGGTLEPIATHDRPPGAEPAAHARDYLVGNSAYGNWQRNPSTGALEWFFIGALANNLFSGPAAPTYQSWYRDRPWTVHTDRVGQRAPTALHQQRFQSAARLNPDVPAYRGAPQGSSKRNISAWTSAGRAGGQPGAASTGFRNSGRNTSSWSRGK